MSTMVRLSRRAAVALLAVAGTSLAPNPFASGPEIAAASGGDRPVVLVAMDPPTDEPADEPTGQPGDGVGTGQPGDGGTGGGGILPWNQNGGLPGIATPTVPPAVSGGTGQTVTEQTVTERTSIDREVPKPPRDLGLMVLAIGASTLAAALAALLLVGWCRNRRQATSAALAAQPMRRPTVVKDGPYQPRHRLQRR